MTGTAEALVILDSASPAGARNAVAAIAPILHSFSDRVFAVTADAANIGAIRHLPGVAQVLTGNETAAGLPNLSDPDALFVNAWLLARQPKSRPGEGLTWDAPGFEPPDRK